MFKRGENPHKALGVGIYRNRRIGKTSSAVQEALNVLDQYGTVLIPLYDNGLYGQRSDIVVLDPDHAKGIQVQLELFNRVVEALKIKTEPNRVWDIYDITPNQIKLKQNKIY